MRHLEWPRRAACRDEDPELFFADDPTAAKAVCARCPVADACLDEARAAGEPWGVRGGLTADERLGDLLLLADACPEPAPHRASRGCYVSGCDRPECREANRVYVAAWRDAGPVTPAGTVVVCEQLTLDVSA